MADPPGLLAVADRLAVRDVLQRTPGPKLERGALHRERQVEDRAPALEVVRELRAHLSERLVRPFPVGSNGERRSTLLHVQAVQRLSVAHRQQLADGTLETGVEHCAWLLSTGFKDETAAVART